MILYPEPEGAVLAKLTLAARVGKGDARLLQNRRAAALHRPDIVLVCAQGNGGRRIQRIVVAGIRHFQAEREFADRFNISAFKVGIVDPDRGHFLPPRFQQDEKETILRHVAVDAVHAAHEHNVLVRTVANVDGNLVRVCVSVLPVGHGQNAVLVVQDGLMVEILGPRDRLRLPSVLVVAPQGGHAAHFFGNELRQHVLRHHERGYDQNRPEPLGAGLFPPAGILPAFFLPGGDAPADGSVLGLLNDQRLPLVGVQAVGDFFGKRLVVAFPATLAVVGRAAAGASFHLGSHFRTIRCRLPFGFQF